MEDEQEIQGTSIEQHSRPQLATTYVAPRNDLEGKLVKIWEQVLGIDQIGVYDDFFELGGHSLMFTQIISRVRKIASIDISIKDLFEKPSIYGIVKKIESSGGEGDIRRPKIVRVSREAYRGGE